MAPNAIDGVDNPDGRAANRRVTISYTIRSTQESRVDQFRSAL